MRREHHDDERLPIEVARQIDSFCDDFEKQLASGHSLSLKEYVDRVTPIGRERLLIELVSLTIEWLRKKGRSDHSELLDANPELRDELESLTKEMEATVAYAVRDTAHAGLHVRCPHCHNPIELLGDAQLQSIRCGSCGSDFSLVDDEQATRAAKSLTQIDHFRLIDRVGMGAFGSVFKAHDSKLDRTVAVKIPRRGQFDERQERDFIREAQNSAQLNHSNIVPVYEVGRDGETLYIVSEFIRGLTLADWLSGQRLTHREAVELIIKLADALQHAHDRGVIHRDLKPGNVMLDAAGEPHLMDFGLAKREAAEITMSLNGRIIGTPAYMSPEQAEGDAHSADARSDVYSLGVILFQLLTGELPFRGNARMLIHQVIHDEPPSPRKLNASVPRDLETISLKCLQKNRERRFDSMSELASELRLWLSGKPIKSRKPSSVARAWRWVRQDRAAGRVAIVALLSALVVLTTFLMLSIALGRDAIAQRRVAENLKAVAEKRAAEAIDASRRAEQIEKMAKEAAEEARLSQQEADYKRHLTEKLQRERESNRRKLETLRQAADEAHFKLDEAIEKLLDRLKDEKEYAQTRAEIERLRAIAQQAHRKWEQERRAADVRPRKSDQQRRRPTERSLDGLFGE